MSVSTLSNPGSTVAVSSSIARAAAAAPCRFARQQLHTKIYKQNGHNQLLFYLQFSFVVVCYYALRLGPTNTVVVFKFELPIFLFFPELNFVWKFNLSRVVFGFSSVCSCRPAQLGSGPWGDLEKRGRTTTQTNKQLKNQTINLKTSQSVVSLKFIEIYLLKREREK